MKYTVLVVEDEINQRRALVERVEWEKAGFEVIGQAENGAEALDKVEQLEPDLIFTDIKMPLISGLELAAKVRELRPATQIVILSGYDSFEYARTAINYNIISYLLKPISSSELSEQLFDIHRRMEERLGGISGKTAQTDSERLNRLTVIEFLQPLMFGGSEQQSGDDEKLKAAAAQLGITDENKRNKFCVLVSKFKKDGKNSVSDEHAVFVDKILGRYLKKAVTFITYGRAVTLAVFEETDIPQNVLELALLELVQTSKRVMDEECTVGISRQFYELSHCPTAYFEAVTARRYTSDGVGHIRYIEDKERDGEVEFEYVEKSVLKIEQLLKVGNADELGEFINDMYENNTPENANLLVVQIIDERFPDEELSLTGVSAELAVSPNYLSALIKKEKKKNFITLLTEKRMKAAYDMLVCSSMKVLEISEKCGYSDQHYFSYCFKKFYGDSPNKVRAVARGEEQ